MKILIKNKILFLDINNIYFLFYKKVRIIKNRIIIKYNCIKMIN